MRMKKSPPAAEKKIGILVAFPPRTSLSNEGIGRLLTMLLKEQTRRSPYAGGHTNMVLAAPVWSRTDLEKLLADNNISPHQVETFYTRGPLLFMSLVALSERLRQKGRGRLLRLLRRSISGIGHGLYQVLILMLSSHSLLVNIILLPLLITSILLVCVAAIWVASHSIVWVVAGMALLGFLLLLLLRNGMQILPHLLPSRAKQIRKFEMLFKKKLRLGQKNIRRHPFFYELFLRIRQLETERLLKSINRRTDIGMWYIPTAFWPEVKGILAPKVIAVPDVVFIDYPTYFTSHTFSRTHDLIRETLKIPAYFLSYSEHVKQRHLVEGFGVDPDRVRIIRHGRSEMQAHLEDKGFSPDMPLRARALHLLRAYQQDTLQGSAYLRAFDFTDCRFFLYPSQARAYKNIIQLLEAHRLLLRKYRVDAKLFLTARVDEIPAIREYIYEHRLGMDVLCFHNIPAKVLSAMNHLAVASVNPSLFEGGFPFTFAEAFSVGTPSLMSDTPHVREMVDDPVFSQLAPAMLFDPYDAEGLARKMAWVIEHRETLLEMQKPLYDKLLGWDTVADQYLEYFQTVMQEG